MARKKNKVSIEETKKKFANVADEITEMPIGNFLKTNFLPYSWSYNLDRALIDVTGLKPVHTRILYTMYLGKLGPKAVRKKVATVAGKTMEFHPHGDSAIIEAIKNLGLAHVFRVPMVDGKGDFGAPGEPGAAGRYIEARLSEAGWINLEELEENAVPMVPSYDGSAEEPSRLPVKWPVGIINGTSGIAIGYASRIPSHNPREIMEACKLLVRNPEATVEDIMKVVQGPDFSMGGKITAIDGVREYLETGSGTFKIRGRYEITPLPRGAYQIDFEEIPFETSPKKIIADIQKAILDKGRLKDIAEYKDLSDFSHPIRIRVITKSGSNYRRVLEELFKETSLESSFSANMTTIVNGKPLQTGILPILQDFITHRKQCVIRKTSFKIGKTEDRLHLLKGLVKVLIDVDKAIELIRKSENRKEANEALCKTFDIDEKQADFVLAKTLGQLTRMEIIDINKTAEETDELLQGYKALVSDDEVMSEYLLKEFDETLKVIDVERVTEISNRTEEEIAEDLKKRKEEKKLANKKVTSYITRFNNGTIMKSLEPFHYGDVKTAKFGLILDITQASTNGNVLFVYEDGTVQRIPVSHIPMDEPKEVTLVSGSEVPLVGISADGEDVQESDLGTLLLTENGKVRIIKPDNYPKEDVFEIMTLDKGDRVINSQWITEVMFENLYVYSITKESKILKYKLDSLSPSGSGSQAIASHNLQGKDEVIFAKASVENAFVTTLAKNEEKVTMGSEINPKGRNSQGVQIGTGKEEIIKAFVSEVEAFGVRTARNTIIALPSPTGRINKGLDSRMTDMELGLL